MKRILLFILVFCMLTGLFVGCKKENSPPATEATIAPTQRITVPTEVTTGTEASAQVTVVPTAATAEPTQKTAAPTEVTLEAETSTRATVVPTTAATEITTQATATPTAVTTEPAQVTTAPTKATIATEPASTQVTIAPTKATAKPTQATFSPTKATTVTEPATTQVTIAPTKATIATEPATTQVTVPTKATAKPTQVVTAPVETTNATEPTIQPTAMPTAAVTEPTEVTAAPTKVTTVTKPSTAKPTKVTVTPTKRPTVVTHPPVATEAVATTIPTEVSAPTEALPTSAPTEVTTQPTLPPLPVDPRFDSLEQEALVKTALAFLDRGKYIQYDDTRLSPNSQPIIYRWEVGLKDPEDYTSQFTGYTNCAAFTHDVYLSALDYEIDAYTTAKLTAKSTAQRKYTYIPTGQETAAERAAVESEFRANLQIGDIIVVRYNGSRTGNGHAMLYVGTDALTNGRDIIHSTGGSYNYKDFTEKTEHSGTVQTMSTKNLFTPGNGLYTFTKLQSLCLIRPLATYKGGVPENTQNRIRNMEGIVAEKLSSHTRGMTVNPGEQMTFTFSVTNKNNTPVTLEIRDIVPANTTYISGAEQVVGSSLSWLLTVPAKGNASVSYTVQVNADAVYGVAISSDDGTVGGVKTACPKVYVQKTLTAAQQAQIESAAYAVTGKTGMDLANAIYKQALGKETGLPTDFTALHDSFFQQFFDEHRLNGDRGILDLIPTGMFGGRIICHRPLASDCLRLEYQRTRLPQTQDLIAGDIILAVGGPNNGGEHLFLFTGERLLNLNTNRTLPAQSFLNTLLAYDRFVVIRPSVGM